MTTTHKTPEDAPERAEDDVLRELSQRATALFNALIEVGAHPPGAPLHPHETRIHTSALYLAARALVKIPFNFLGQEIMDEAELADLECLGDVFSERIAKVHLAGIEEAYERGRNGPTCAIPDCGEPKIGQWPVCAKHRDDMLTGLGHAPGTDPR
jgi:hypothetical protein